MAGGGGETGRPRPRWAAHGSIDDAGTVGLGRCHAARLSVCATQDSPAARRPPRPVGPAADQRGPGCDVDVINVTNNSEQPRSLPEHHSAQSRGITRTLKSVSQTYQVIKGKKGEGLEGYLKEDPGAVLDGLQQHGLGPRALALAQGDDAQPLAHPHLQTDKIGSMNYFFLCMLWRTTQFRRAASSWAASRRLKDPVMLTT